MMNAITIELESDDGEPIDIKALAADLLEHGLKVRRTANGFHILSAIALRAAQESIVNAISIALPGEEGELPEPEAEPPKWDDAITWDNGGGKCRLPLPIGVAWDLNTDRIIDEPHHSCQGQRRVYAYSPGPGENWAAAYTGPGTSEDVIQGADQEDPTVMLRFGWAPPGAIEALPEFEGF